LTRKKSHLNPLLKPLLNGVRSEARERSEEKPEILVKEAPERIHEEVRREALQRTSAASPRERGRGGEACFPLLVLCGPRMVPPTVPKRAAEPAPQTQTSLETTALETSPVEGRRSETSSAPSVMEPPRATGRNHRTDPASDRGAARRLSRWTGSTPLSDVRSRTDVCAAVRSMVLLFLPRLRTEGESEIRVPEFGASLRWMPSTRAGGATHAADTRQRISRARTCGGDGDSRPGCLSGNLQDYCELYEGRQRQRAPPAESDSWDSGWSVCHLRIVVTSRHPINPGRPPNRTRRRLRPSVLRVRIRGCRDDLGLSAVRDHIAEPREGFFRPARSMRAHAAQQLVKDERRPREFDPREYISTWTEKDLLHGRSWTAWVIIVRNTGLLLGAYSGCSMCGYVNDVPKRSRRRH